MDESVENAYFNWLVSKVLRLENSSPSLTFYNLFRTLHTTEYVWLVSGDDNRVEDGLELRLDFLTEANIGYDPDEAKLEPCSVFEMLIAFSNHAEFTTDTPARGWFWVFLTNLGLAEYCDAAFRKDEAQTIIDEFVWRRTTMFPLTNQSRGYLNVQVWYQFCTYLAEEHGLL